MALTSHSDTTALPGPRTVGVEEELLLVDDSTGALAPLGDEVVADQDRRDEPPLEHEFKREQIETATAPSATLAALRQQLVRGRAAAADHSRSLGLSPLALATSPLRTNPTATDDERYERMQRIYGLVSRNQLTCGMHVHVSIASRAEGIAVLDRLRPWLPVLLALSANSPFWQGVDTGYASYRYVSWSGWPSAGPTEVFGDEQTYDEQVRQIIASGAALDDGMVYFDARLSATYPTLEIRVADVCASIDDALVVAALARGLVDTLALEAVNGVALQPISQLLLRASSWRAARYGLTGELVDPQDGALRTGPDVVRRLLDRIAPALSATGDEAEVRGLVEELLARGTGSERQRAVLARTGRLGDVIAAARARTAQA